MTNLNLKRLRPDTTSAVVLVDNNLVVPGLALPLSRRWILFYCCGVSKDSNRLCSRVGAQSRMLCSTTQTRPCRCFGVSPRQRPVHRGFELAKPRVRCAAVGTAPTRPDSDWRKKAKPIKEGSAYPAKENCSHCGLCDTYYVAHVKDACAFLGSGMWPAEA